MDNNPWTVEDLDSYLFYCCPECDQKYKSKPSFINHAYSSHPDAKENLKFEETTEDIVIKSDVNIKEENDIIENSNEFDNKEPENDIDTGKCLSEALLFAEHGGEHVVNKNCSECQKHFLYTTCSPQV